MVRFSLPLLLFGALALSALAFPSEPSTSPSTIKRAAAPDTLHFTPGPGLPTLEALGITPEQLYNMTLEHIAEIQQNNALSPSPSGRLDKRQRYPCYSEGGSLPAGIQNIVMCNLYLQNLGTTQCRVGPVGTPTLMCSSNMFAGETGADVVGWARGSEGGYASSYCRDVAAAVYEVGTTCPLFCIIKPKRCGLGGIFSAHGNGDLVVEVSGYES